jgi:hypothetical protein
MSTHTITEDATQIRSAATVDLKLEVVVIPAQMGCGVFINNGEITVVQNFR